MIQIFSNLVLIVLSLVSVTTSDWYISPFGDDGSGTGSESNPFRSLMKAVSACSGGDTIVVMPGNYYSSGTINTAINIIAQEGVGTAYFIQTGLLLNSPVNITGIVFFGVTSGSAVNPYNGNGVVVVTNCNFTSNSVAISISGSNPLTVINSTFNNNGQDIGGGGLPISIFGSTFQQSGGISNNGPLSISDSVFSGNTNPSSGAISVSNSELTVKNTQFISMSTNANTGGAAISLTNSELTMMNTHFINCSTKANGGAILISAKSAANILSSTFSSNSAANGGAVYIQTSSFLSIFNSDFKNNMALVGGAYACDSTGHLDQVGCTFESSTVGSCLS